MNCPTKSLRRVKRWVEQDKAEIKRLSSIPSAELTSKQSGKLLRLLEDAKQRIDSVETEIGGVILKETLNAHVLFLRAAASKLHTKKRKKRPLELD